VFLERQLVGPRHIEIQIFGDTHGNVIHLGERECSIQRRHQKIVEEAPSSAVSETLRAQMGAASVALGQAIGYVGAGTVEYLVDNSGSFFFLEMNTRLQVEHPVTEMVTGLDLVEWQINVANGTRLPLTQDQVVRQGHAIEVRLYAEDPAQNFMPGTGKLTMLQSPAASTARWDSGFVTGNVVSPHYDPMLAKVIALGPTRAAAATRLANELAATSVHGVVTNAASLVAILRSEAFLSGDTTTAFLDRFPDVLTPELSSGTRQSLVAAVLAERACVLRATDRRWGFASSGWRNLPTQQQLIRFQHGDTSMIVAHSVSDGAVSWVHDDAEHRAGVRGMRAGAWMVEFDGVSSLVTVRCDVPLASAPEEGCRWYANNSDGQMMLVELPRFDVPSAAAAGGGSTAPVPGRIVSVQVAVGDAVSEGQVLVILEAMKMEHSIRAAASATVSEVRVSVGDQVDARQVLVVLA
jgi:propionyl-CoA carboxylase alpha chain